MRSAPSLPPGPARTPVRQTWTWVRSPTRFLEEGARRFGRRFTLRFVGKRKLVVVWHPEDVQSVFTGSQDVFLSGRANQSFKAFVGENTLFALDGEPHRRHRKLLMPPFHGERMRAYGALIRDLTEAAVRTWPIGRRFSMLRAMTDLTLQIILQAVFGVREPERLNPLTDIIHRLISTPAIVAFMPALHIDLGPWSPWGRFVRLRRRLDDILFDEIARAHRERSNREDILAKLIDEGERSGDPFSDQEIRDELMTLLGAGHETTAASLAWAFQWILADGDVHRRLRSEIRESDILQPPKLVEAAVQETLRLNPPIPMVLRWLASESMDLPQGTYVCPSPHLTHRDPALYPEPSRFDPERFLRRRPSPFEFYPFGGGHRTCIGMAFANFEMKIVLATVLHRTTLKPAAKPSDQARRKNIVLVPAHGTPVVLEKLR